MASNTMRLSGINSGFDTEAMIQQMMSAYQMKIDTQSKKLQTLQWKQEQYRDITSKLTTFKNKYFDILKRDTYLMSPTSFTKMTTNVTTKSGKESGLKVTASSGAAAGTHTLKVSQTATSATTKGGQVAPQNFKLDVEKAMNDSKLDETTGKYNFSLDVKVGNVAKTVEFSGSNKDELLASLNYELEDAFGTTSSGSAFISAELKDGEFAFKTSGNATATVTERTGNFGMGKPAARVAIDPAAALTGTSSISVTVPNFYSGEAVTKNIEFATVSNTYFDARDTNSDINEAFLSLKKAAFAKKNNVDVNAVTEKMMNENKFIYSSVDAAHDLNSQTLTQALNGAFAFEQGISFAIDGSSMTAQYMQDGSAAEFTMTSTCDATFGLKKGSATSYIEESTKLSDLGIATTAHFDDGDFYTMNINGKEIKVGENATIKDLMNAVNKSGAGVTMSYSKLEGAFTLTANDKGNGGDIRIADDDPLAQALKLTAGAGASHTEGRNAVINIDGVEVEHNDNVYEMDGVKFDFSDVDPTEGETITVNVGKDTDSVVENIRSFVEDYNKLIDEIAAYTYTSRPTDSKNNFYDPLTDEDKEDMSEKEIEKWEEAAKKGLLYHDSTVMSVMNKIRTALIGSVTLEDGSKFGLYSMGVKTASFLTGSAEDARLGKLTLDEDALRKALDEKPDAVIKLFTDPDEGVMAKTKNAIESAVKEGTKTENSGTLIRKAGTEKGTSAKTNAIYKEMERINKRIEKLQTTYDKKEEYWWKVFTNLEKMQAQFNSQQSYISQFTANGGYLS